MSLPCTRALAAGLAAWCVAAGASAALFEDCSVRDPCRRVGAAELGRLRGGFTLGGPGAAMHLSFGIAQAVMVNDQLVAVTQFTLPDAGAVIASFSTHSVDMTALASALRTMNAALPDATLASGGAAGAAPAQAAAETGLRVNGRAIAPGSPALALAGAEELRGLLVQNGPGNLAQAGSAPLALPPGATVIQNSLSNQTIRALTLLNVSASVHGALSAARIQESVRQTIAESLR